MGGGLVTVIKGAGAFKGDVDIHLTPWQFAGVTGCGDLHGATASINEITANGNITPETAMNTVVTEQMGEGFDRGCAIDGHHLNIIPALFDNTAQDRSANAAKPVNSNTNCHAFPQD